MRENGQPVQVRGKKNHGKLYRQKISSKPEWKLKRLKNIADPQEMVS